jgi:hypothetical protein
MDTEMNEKVHLQNTPITDATMVSTRWFKGLASFAIFFIFLGAL